MFKQLNEKYDKLSAHLSVYSGAGGDDAKDWANMLFRMYSRYAENRGWKVTQTNERDLEIKADYAYGILKKETGVHRLVRISPFSAKKLRHTSFALVEVVPIFKTVEYQNIKIPEEDLKIEFSKSSGPGGQNVNKRETAVRAVHIPTGISVHSQSERSQAQNKEKALHLLKSKLFYLMKASQKNEISELTSKAKPEWGNQIRSYVLHPYKQVKDHRTGVKTTKVDDVLNGELDKFIESDIEL